MRFLTKSRIIGTGLTKPAYRSGISATSLMQSAFGDALNNAGIEMKNLDGLVAVPSLAHPRFMEAHYFATRMKLLPQKNFIAKTIDTGGAGPISALLEADRMIRLLGCDCVAVVASDSVSSLPSKEFLRRADSGCSDGEGAAPLKSPVIPLGYDRIAKWHVDNKWVTREQLAMVSVLMSQQSSRHPMGMTRKPHTLKEVLESSKVGDVTNVLECARRADGGAALIVASSRFISEKLRNSESSKAGELTARYGTAPVIISGGESSGPLFPPQEISETIFSCEEAVKMALENSQLGSSDIDFFGLYDCFPICFIRAVEAVGLAPKYKGGEWVEAMYRRSLISGSGSESNRTSDGSSAALPPSVFPVNTHGGLLSFGAPWETPAMYNVIEAVDQLTGRAGNRQVPEAKRALVYGNGGIFSASAVAILGKGSY